MNLQQLLKLPIFRSDLDEGESVPLKECLFDLLKMVFQESKCFSGKRPWGISGWEYDIYVALIKQGLIKGKLYEDGSIEKVNEKEACKFVINQIIKPLFNK